MIETEIAVVGAGPAGLSAAVEASLTGASVAIVDEYHRPGGQYFKQLPATFKPLDRFAVGLEYGRGLKLMEEVQNGNIRLFTDSLVWAAFEPGILEIYREGECQRLRAERTIVSTGAYDRPVPFPGWTLPGVTTAGAAQTLVKSQRVLPGRRVLLAGTGPFLLPVAAELLSGGAYVVGLLEASRTSEWLRGLPCSWRHAGKIREALGYLLPLLRAKVLIRTGWTVFEARGSERVEQAVIGQLDRYGRPIPGTEELLEVDTICTGFGFIPSLQLPRLLGCESKWDADVAGWVSVADRDQRSTVPTVFVAGEATGIGGHDVALGEGAIAGVKAATDLGKLTSAQAEDRLAMVRRELSRHREFATYLNRTFAFKEGLMDLMHEDTVLCRCEEVTVGEVVRAAREWGATRTIKQLTRAGMGQCQGRICGTLVAQIAARESGKTMQEIGLDSPRPPIKPIPLGALARLDL